VRQRYGLPFSQSRRTLSGSPSFFQPHCQVIGRIDTESQPLTCSIKPNGELVLEPSALGLPGSSKIRWAFMGADAYLCTGRQEVPSLGLLSSSRPAHRYLYAALSPQHKVTSMPPATSYSSHRVSFALHTIGCDRKDDLVGHLRRLFKVQGLIAGDANRLSMVFEGDTEVEIMLAGGACKKVFVSLVG
jgi:hypothetical protein